MTKTTLDLRCSAAGKAAPGNLGGNCEGPLWRAVRYYADGSHDFRCEKHARAIMAANFAGPVYKPYPGYKSKPAMPFPVGTELRFTMDNLGASERDDLGHCTADRYGVGDTGVASFPHPNPKLAREGWFHAYPVDAPTYYGR